ncbi:hypothetical protein ATK36_2787 [Amycolatopsis sulphurea]|uniref:Uncharacterized protein n=1 Tax=Amycolatopsis sulphurea TaxID=76022 RepID=A0A2A9F9V7_9PSEU|nr:hypothetical protein [Amycolatopsis sulphurea]PFG47733.1 hypothetical protein ATK36_2787 [Amycolatopsis sulphurea]
MSIFGQVWLWSLLAFFVGVLVSWLVLLRPVRRRVRDLEDQLVKAHADAARTPVNAGATSTAVLSPAPAETATWRPDEAAPTELFQPAGRGFEPEAEYEAEYRTAPEPVTDDEVDEAFARADAEETGLLGLADYRAAEQTTVAGFAALDGSVAAEPGHVRSEPGTVDAGFTGGSIVEPEEPGYPTEPDYLAAGPDRAEQSGVDSDCLAAEQATVEPGFAEIAPEESIVDSDGVAGHAFSGLSSDEPVANGDAPVREESTMDSHDESDYHAAAAEYLVPEEESGSGYHRAPEPEPSVVEHRPSSAGFDAVDEPVSLFQPAARPSDPVPEPDWFGGGAAAERSPFEEPAPVGHPAESVPTDHLRPAEGGRGEAEPDPVDDGSPGLPKRRRRESPLGGFDAPRPIQPSMRPVERRDPELTGAHSGSLFEPAVRPNQVQQAAPPEPSPARHDAVDAVPPGPFGPGSAMPRPGGGRPADGFSVKASVTALRYCTDESAQFPKMVAEVWFRTAADAERVGFRPLH